MSDRSEPQSEALNSFFRFASLTNNWYLSPRELTVIFSAKLNHNTKYTEIRRAQNRVALLQEQQEQLTKEQNQLARKKRKAEEEEEIKSDPDAAKKRKTEREVQQQIKDDEEALGDEETDPDAIWSKPAAVDEEKTKEQEYDEFFQDLFL